MAAFAASPSGSIEKVLVSELDEVALQEKHFRGKSPQLDTTAEIRNICSISKVDSQAFKRSSCYKERFQMP